MKATALAIAFFNRCIGRFGFGAAHKVDDLPHFTDGYVGRLPFFDLHRRSGPAGRLWATLSNRRRPCRPHDTGCSQRWERFPRCFPREKRSAFAHSVQESDAAVFCGFQLQGRQGLV